MQATANLPKTINEQHSKKPDPPTVTATTTPATQAKERYGRKCGSLSCQKVHGKKDQQTEHIVRLSIVCDKCEAVYYCSKACRKAAAEHHGTTCANRQQEHRQERNSRLQKIPCDGCDKVLLCTQMKRCSRCRAATYCSVDCQRNDWVKHKTMCVQTTRK